MAWRRLGLTARRGNRRSRLHLDESVPAHVEKTLADHGYHATTTRTKRMTHRSDEDQAAHAWREGRSIVTFDYDFLDPSKLPQTRNPGVIIIDCDRGRNNEVERAVQTLSQFERIVGPVKRRMRIIVRPHGEVSVWGKSHPRSAPDARYRFSVRRPPEIWEE